MSISSAAVRRRPKDRKEQILEAARTLIVQQGYHNVSMAQIAEEVGITAGGLYRHFANKSVLLGAVIAASFDDVTPDFDPDKPLARMLAETCELAVRRRDVGALWWREAGNLPDDMWEELRQRAFRINRRYADLIRIERPELPQEGAEKLAWGVQAILASTSSHPLRLPVPEFAALLTRACESLCAAQLSPVQPVAERTPVLEVVSKRERLLGHAIALFAERGYEATGLDDIGAAAGVTGPSLYSYFSGKADLLRAAVERGTSALWLLLNQALRTSDAPQDALAALVHGYVGLALDRMILTLLLPTVQLTLAGATEPRKTEYVTEWTTLLRASRPGLDETSARILVYTAFGVVHMMMRIGRVQGGGPFRQDLETMTMAVLFSR